MKIVLENIGKRYRYDWIFRGVNYVFESSKTYAITGHNGAGKSTFMRMLSSHLSPTKGQIEFSENDKVLDINDVYKKISYAAPYIELIEELTLTETLAFHQNFKPLLPSLDQHSFFELLELKKAAKKEIRHFSSGMKQRLKLGLAICSDTPILLLDEPTTNLDRQGVNWYLNLLEKYSANRITIIASNVTEDFGDFDATLDITDYKKKKTS